MDDEDFPRGKRRKTDTDAEAKQVKSISLDKELFSEVNHNFICLASHLFYYHKICNDLGT